MNNYFNVCRSFAVLLIVFTNAQILAAEIAEEGVAPLNPYKQKWVEPLQLRLPEPSRTILLAGHVDAAQWLRENNLHQARLINQGRQTLAQFNMSDEQWARQEGDLCQQAGVMACDAGACQTIQLRSQVSNGKDSEAIKARIVQNAPDIETLPESEAEGGSCTNGALLMDLATSDAAGGVHLNLDLRQGQSQNANEGDAQASAGQSAPQTEAAQPVSEDAQAKAGQQNTSTDPYRLTEPQFVAKDFSLSVQGDFAGGAALQTDTLPADTSDYTLLVGEACNSVSVPLSSVSPAYVPRLVVALVSGNAAALGAGYGMTLLHEHKMLSSDDTLAIYASVAQNVDQVLPLLALDSNFLVAGREYIYGTTAAPGLPTYSDPFATFTYGPQHSGALALHKASEGDGQTIAVIDTGMALDHPDLAGRIEHADFTGKGWTADAHGTAVAGIIAAAADNALGSYGVAPKANILGLKACQPKQPGGLAAQCWTSTLVQALDTAIARDAEIINMSLAGPPDDVLGRYVALAVKQNRLLVAGAGNGGAQALPAFPAALPGVLAVTAINKLNRQYQDANLGEYIDIAAPGVDIVTIAPDGSYPSSSGTSWAAAHVSGVAALLKPLMPLSNAADIAHVLRSSSVDLGEQGKDAQFGYGLIDACAAATAATADAVTCAQEGDDYAQR